MFASELGTETQNSTIAVCVNIPIENEAIIKGLGMELSFKLCSIGMVVSSFSLEIIIANPMGPSVDIRFQAIPPVPQT